jgi:four helix bundle protein
MAYGSSREVEYQVGLARRLGYLGDEDAAALEAQCGEVSKVLNGLIRSFRPA